MPKRYNKGPGTKKTHWKDNAQLKVRCLLRSIRSGPSRVSSNASRFGSETTYNLEFQLSHVPEYLHLPILSVTLGMRFNKETSVEAATPHNIVTHSKVRPATLQSKRKHVPWTPEEDATILKMREVEGCSWDEIPAPSLTGLKGISRCTTLRNSKSSQGDCEQPGIFISHLVHSGVAETVSTAASEFVFPIPRYMFAGATSNFTSLHIF
jgi:hypothetical protein